MSLEFWLEQDQEEYGDPEPDLVLLDADRVRFTEGGLAESAEIGESAVGGIALDDPDGTLDVVGWRHFRVYENTAPADNQLIWRGRVMDRTYRRGPRTGERSSIRLGAGRVIDCDLSDQNVNLTRRIFTGSDANRPAETAGERLAWLIAEPRFPGFDFGHVEYPTDNLDANDYRGQTSRDILGDVAVETGSTYWIHYNEAQTANELFFIDPNSTDYSSTLTISNDLDDVDGVTVFAPMDDATLRRSPSRIAYGVYLPYTNGSVYVNDEDTGIAFARVDRAAPMANVKSENRATRIANRFLADNDEEDDRINCTIRVPAAQVNDLRVGHRVLVKFTHFPGYETARWMRTLRRTVQQDEEADAGWFRISLELTPIMAACGASIWQHGQGLTLASEVVFATAPQVGSLLVVAISWTGTPEASTVDTFTRAGGAQCFVGGAGDIQNVELFYRIATSADAADPVYLVTSAEGGDIEAYWAEVELGGSPEATPIDTVTVDNQAWSRPGGVFTTLEVYADVDASSSAGEAAVAVGAFFHSGTQEMSGTFPNEVLETAAHDASLSRWSMLGWRTGDDATTRILFHGINSFPIEGEWCGVAISWRGTC